MGSHIIHRDRFPDTFEDNYASATLTLKDYCEEKQNASVYGYGSFRFLSKIEGNILLMANQDDFFNEKLFPRVNYFP